MSFVLSSRSCLPIAVALVCAAPALAGGTTTVPYFDLLPWGDDTGGRAEVPTVPSSVTVTRVSLGLGHGVVCYSDGTIALWGSDSDGQATAPTIGAGLTFVDAQAGRLHTIAKLSDGSIVAWGNNQFGQTTVPDLGGLTATFIAAGNNHNLALLDSGSVIGWGDSASGQTIPPLGLGAITALAAGNNHSLALSIDGSIIGWGNNADGQLDAPVLDVGQTYTSIQAGNNFSVALTSAGAIKVWGNSAYTTIPATAGTIVEVGGRFENAYAVSNDDLVYVWGNNTNAQNTDVPSFRKHNIVQVAVGSRFLVAAAARDCDEDQIDDRDEIINQDPNSPVDCDGDGELDSCSIATDADLDFNNNDRLDRCEDLSTTVDCDQDGIIDELEIDNGAADCDGDTVLDSCQIAEDSSLDCNEDGELDSCSPTATGVNSGNFVSPIGPGTVVTASGNNRAPAAFDVEVKVTARADLDGWGEWFELSLNDTIIDYVFVTGGEACATSDQVETVLINKALWNSLVEENGNVSLKLKATQNVSSTECPNSRAKLQASWLSDFSDCNGNGTPDLCELRDGLVSDVDEDGVPDSCQTYPRGDLNRDRRSDVLLYNSANERLNAWYMDYDSNNGVEILSKVTYPRLPSTWRPGALGDFDGDGYADMLQLKNNGIGVRIQLMQGDNYEVSGSPGSLQSRRWTLLTVADIDGNGKSDLVWWHTYLKTVEVWLIEGVLRTDRRDFGTTANVSFLGAGDVDNDGDDDLLFRNDSTGIVQLWKITNGQVETRLPLVDGPSIGAAWQARGVGDIDGDGKADVIWRNKNNQTLKAWLLDGGTFLEEGAIEGVATGFDVAAVADYNGDAKTDLAMVRASNKELQIWLLNGFERIDAGTADAIGSSRVVKP